LKPAHVAHLSFPHALKNSNQETNSGSTEQKINYLKLNYFTPDAVEKLQEGKYQVLNRNNEINAWKLIEIPRKVWRCLLPVS
jgi:hypothetical protein